MKKNLFPIFVLVCLSSSAQVINSDSLYKALKEQQKEINQQYSNQVNELKTRIHVTDSSLNASIRNNQFNVALKQMQDRLQKIEKINQIKQSRDSSIFSNYYFAAIQQLEAIEEINNQIVLLQQSQAFYDNVNSVGNPLNYSQFGNAYSAFKNECSRRERTKQLFNIAQNFFTTAGTASGLTLNPALTATFFASKQLMGDLSSFYDTRNYNEMIPILNYTMGFENDVHLTNGKMTEILKNIRSLRPRYKNLLFDALHQINIDTIEYRRLVVDHPNDPQFRDQFEDLVKSRINMMIDQYLSSEENWKINLLPIFSKLKILRIEYASLLLTMKSTYSEYNTTFNKYSDTPYISNNIVPIKDSLKSLIQALDRSFNPEEYYENSFVLFSEISI